VAWNLLLLLVAFLVMAFDANGRASFVEKIAICIAASFVEGEFEETCQTLFEPLTSQR
jgi:hypothetical protein